MKKLIFPIGLFFLVSLSQAQLQWYPQNSGNNSYLTDVHFTDQFNGWVSGIPGRIMHTSDGGASWYQQDPPPNNVYYSVYFPDINNGWASGDGGKIIHTSDGGETWEPQFTASSTLYQIYFVDADDGWAVGGDNGSFPNYDPHRILLHTGNGGTNWTVQIGETGSPLLRSVHFIDKNIGWAVGESGSILHTSDGGANWGQQMADQSYHFYGVHFTNSSNGYVVGNYLGLPHVSVIFNTIDGGENWTSQTFGTDETFSDICFTDENRGWAVGGMSFEASIAYTIDAGENWTIEYPGFGTGLSALSFVNNSTGWAVGNFGTIITTSTTTGFVDQAKNSDISIFPNPASSQINIELPIEINQAGILEIYNSIGKLVYSTLLSANSGRIIQKININEFSEGFYTMVINRENETSVEKLIIQR